MKRTQPMDRRTSQPLKRAVKRVEQLTDAGVAINAAIDQASTEFNVAVFFLRPYFEIQAGATLTALEQMAQAD